MEVLHPCCAGLDVHKASVVACVRKTKDGNVSREVRTFGTNTSDLFALSEWLQQEGCTHVAMEATGVYWKPVWHVLEGSFELVLGNAKHIRNVPGRKSDVNDATWLANLLAHGLIQPSLVPERPFQELRDLTRTRKQLTHEAARHVNRIQKVLEDANVKLANVVSDVLGVSGRAILDAIVGGETDPVRLAAVAKTAIRAKPNELIEALRGSITAHHRFLLKLHLEQVGAIQASIALLDQQIEEACRPFVERVERLDAVPGISRLAAQVILAETGGDLDRFETADRLVSFAGLCPRQDESAGKKRSTRVRHAGVWLKSTIVSCAWAAARKKDSYYRAQFLRLKARRGPKKAIIAVAASILTAVYYMLRDGTHYQDLGPDHFSRIDRTKRANRLCRQLQQLGFSVRLTEAA